MPLTPLHDRLASAGARFGQYGGAETAAAFGDVAAEFAALRSGCGVYDLGWRAKFAVTGADRVRWLNGMITNNVRDLPSGGGVYAFLLSPQGRIQADLYCYQRGASLLLDTDAAQAPRLRELLEKFIIMDDVELTDLGEQLTALGVAGPRAAEVLRSIGILDRDLEPLAVRDVAFGAGAESEFGVSVVRSDLPTPAYEVWVAPAKAPWVWQALVAAGAQAIGWEALELLRIWHGRPRYGPDISERDLPQETAQERALHFRKGCYIGQEIVERIHARGAVHRVFTQLAVAGPPPAPGTKIMVGEQEAGEVTSAASIPLAEGARTIALGYVRREALAGGAELRIGAARALPTRAPAGERAAANR